MDSGSPRPLTEPVSTSKAADLLAVEGKECTIRRTSTAASRHGRPHTEITVGPTPTARARARCSRADRTETALRNRDWVGPTCARCPNHEGRWATSTCRTHRPRPRYFKRYFYHRPIARDHHRRAPQRRRPGGRLLHRHPAPPLHQQLGDALRHGPAHAARGDSGAEGDDHRRNGGQRRRPSAVDVPQALAGPVDRQADLGRPRRHPRLPGADGRRDDPPDLAIDG